MIPLSFIVINRILEDGMIKDPSIREKLNQQGRGVLSDGRKMSDDQLLTKL